MFLRRDGPVQSGELFWAVALLMSLEDGTLIHVREGENRPYFLQPLKRFGDNKAFLEDGWAAEADAGGSPGETWNPGGSWSFVVFPK